MSFIKLCQLYIEQEGQAVYLEDVNEQVEISKSITYPANVNCEILTFANEQDFIKRINVTSFRNEVVSMPDNSISIRQLCLNTLKTIEGLENIN